MIIMKLKSFWIALPIAISAVTFTSCKKDKVEPNDSATVYTPEQNKTNLQNAGQALIQDMNSMKNLEGMHTVESFNFCVNESDPFDGIVTFLPAIVLNALETSTKNHSIKPIKESLKTGEGDTFFSVFESVKGLYTWSNGVWTKTTSNNVVFNFPATKGGNVNNATFTITATEYTGNQMDAQLDGFTPSAIQAKLDVVGKGTVVQFDFSVDYLTNGEPSKLLSKLNLAPYLFTYEFNNSGSKISQSFKFDKSTANLATLYMEANGTFNKTSIENFINEEQMTNANDVVTSASGYVKVKDIKLSMTANVADAINYYEGIGDANFDDNNTINMLNSNASIKLMYASSSQLIANTEWYLESETYTNYAWDEVNQIWVEVQETSENPNVRLVFSDGSKSDLETYFGNGFDDLFNDFETFFSDLESSYDF